MADVAEAQTFKSTTLTPSQRYELERVCNNRLNWSDGGHWIGRGAKPNCFNRDTISNRISHTYHFPTDAVATKWNLEWEKAIRYSGHLATTGITVAVTLMTGGLAGIVVGTLAAITKDEVQAQISYPRMARGWTYEIIFEHSFRWSPHPWGQRDFSQTVKGISKDFTGKITAKTQRTIKYKLDELPDGAGRMLASSPSRSTRSNYN